jgi:outer membrane protein assembly factor BamB
VRQGFVMCGGHSELVMSASAPSAQWRTTRSVAPMVAVLTLVVAGCTSPHARLAPKTATTSPQPSASAPPAVSTPPGEAPASSRAPASGPGLPAPASSAAPPSVAAGLAVTATTISVRLPVALSRVVAVPLNGTVVVAGGLDPRQVTTSQTLVFDPGSPSIRAAGHLAIAVHDAGAGVVGGSALVVGGGSAASSNAVQAVHADGTAAVVGRLPQLRSDDSVAVAGDQLYVIGGYDGVHELPGVLTTTDGATFRAVGQLGETVRYGAAYASSDAVWIFGGEHQGQPIADIQRVDIGTGVSTVVGKLPHALAHAAVVILGGQVLILGGSDGRNPQNTIFAFDPATGSVSLVGSMPESVSDMATAVVGDTAYVLGGNALTAEQTIAPTTTIVAVKIALVSAQASVQGAPAALFSGKLLIADRGNNRLTLVDPAGTIDWTFPNAAAPAPPSGFFFPDDAFFIDHGTAILSNQEGNNTIVEISYPAGRPLWSYGHPGTAGAATGYLHEPDDAYKLADGRVIVADANNCRVLIINAQAQPIGQIGTTGGCIHKPPTSLGYPNGDTPLQNGNVLISEVTGSWISEYTMSGTLVWTIHLPLTYPSDPQQIGPDTYLAADYTKPGGVVEFDRAGHILWEYRVPSGHGMLDHPSLAEVLPSGVICVNDDYRHRVVMIDPKTKTIVWQYGVDDVSGTAPGLLNTPDGFDLLAPDGTTPTHPWTG